MERRVVVTGLGLVTPVGIGVEETWSALVAGKSG
ncbi:MAG: beta-ketoacyl synthase N-terminal-like domain-containing protein, partial [Syntrophobacterales bacterium]